MADQLSILPSGQVIPTALHLEVQQSYLEYAMSVIVGRALPDARDGLKPVHRRILYAMHELGLTPDRPYRKCARVVGDVLGKYHPHGDQSVYDALVRMVQDFSSRYPLLQGHGNFGSVDDDPPAAMRYTETRLAAVGNEGLLTEISEDTVDFTGNFDNSQQEPIVLPAQLPFLLLNGCTGIAVGMATNIPPHNLGEVIDGLIALIDRPELPNEELFKLIPAPDFPTGGEIIGLEGVRDAYATGRGSVPVRGVANVEEITVRGKQRRTALVITELPFQVNKASWIEKIADLTNQGRIEGIIDIRDESDREGMRVVIELKRDAQPALILNTLYKLTPLQSNFGVIMLAIVDGQPRQLPLRDLLQTFIDFREETLTRQYNNELEKAQARAHILEGQILALENLDTVINILRNAPDGTTAKMQMKEVLEFSDRQADSILSMPLRRLTGLERQNLQTEFDEVEQRMQELHNLLDNRKELLKSLKKDLRSLKRKYADPRRTRILSATERAAETAQLAEVAAEELASEETIVELTQRGYIRRLTPKAFQKRQQTKTEEPPTNKLIPSDDFTLEVHTAAEKQELLVLTRSGKAYTLNVGDIPLTPRQSKGTPAVALLPLTNGDTETIVAQYLLPTEPAALEGWFLVMLTQQGRIKRVPLAEFTHINSRGLTATKVKEDDELAYAIQVQVGDQLVIATTGGRILRFQVDDEQIPVMGRAAQGIQIVRLRKQESLVGCVALGTEDEMLLVTNQGYAKRMDVKLVRTVKRGDLGIQGIQFALKTDALAAIAPAFPDTEVILLTTEDQMIKNPVEAIPQQGREGTGDRLVKLTKKEGVKELAIADVEAVEE
jgi:DNA gyrase subunit A